MSTYRERGHWLEAPTDRRTIYHLGAAMVNILVIIDGPGPLADVKLHLSKHLFVLD
ncbi:hypothetical protein [Sporosarcina sp. FSL K6-2383]|uniref:hypothetical protein n=1 Tax=Sporosarcina sp. FSL K6-2383 TaxID=2921556 RepID=UPI00315B3373